MIMTDWTWKNLRRLESRWPPNGRWKNIRRLESRWPPNSRWKSIWRLDRVRWPPMVGEKIRGRGGSFGQKACYLRRRGRKIVHPTSTKSLKGH